MKITLTILAAFIIIAAALFIMGSVAGIWFSTPQPEEAQDPVTVSQVILEQPGVLSIKQGKSEPEALLVSNKTGRFVNFTLSHTQTHLTLEPRTGLIAPYSSITVAIHIDDLFPPGGIEIMAYLLAETKELNSSMEAYHIPLEIIPGELQLQTENGLLQAIWQGEPAPPGVAVSFRDPEVDGTAWRTWGETPDLAPPDYLRPGYHVFEFIALFGTVKSSVEMLEIYIPEEASAEEETSRAAVPEPQQTGTEAAGESEEELTAAELLYGALCHL